MLWQALVWLLHANLNSEIEHFGCTALKMWSEMLATLSFLYSAVFVMLLKPSCVGNWLVVVPTSSSAS